MIDTREEMRDTVYQNLYQTYKRFAMAYYEYITPELEEIIRLDAQREFVLMMLDGNLKNYYQRIKRNAL